MIDNAESVQVNAGESMTADEVNKEEKSPLEEAKKFNEENKELLRKITEERKKLEKLTADALVNGRSVAGQPQIKKSEEQIKKEEAMKFWEGTGIDKAIEKYG